MRVETVFHMWAMARGMGMTTSSELLMDTTHSPPTPSAPPSARPQEDGGDGGGDDERAPGGPEMEASAALAIGQTRSSLILGRLSRFLAAGFTKRSGPGSGWWSLNEAASGKECVRG